MIGRNYMENNDLKNNIDQFGDGTAQYAYEAIQAYINHSI